MKVDLKELERQRKESIIKSNEFCEVDIIVGRNDFQPIANIYVRGVSDLEVAILMKSLESVLDSLKKRHPQAYGVTKFLGSEMTEIDVKNNKNQGGN